MVPATSKAASLSLATSIARKTASARASDAVETVVDTALAVAARVKVVTVAATSGPGTAADAASAPAATCGQTGGWRQATAGQAVTQLQLRPIEPTAHAACRASQPTGSLLVSPPLEVAEHDGPAILLGQAADLLIEQATKLGPRPRDPGSRDAKARCRTRLHRRKRTRDH